MNFGRMMYRLDMKITQVAFGRNVTETEYHCLQPTNFIVDVGNVIELPFIHATLKKPVLLDLDHTSVTYDIHAVKPPYPAMKPRV